MNLLKKTYCLLLAVLYSVILQAQDNQWSVNIYDYQYDMSLYAELIKDDAVVADYSNYEVAAFVGKECRGIAELQSVTKDGQEYQWMIIRVRSNMVSGETVSFKIYDKNQAENLYIQETVPFISQERIGLPSSPFQLGVKSYILGDVNDDKTIDSDDIVSLEKYILGKEVPVFIQPAADFNLDDQISISDIVSLVNTINK